MSVRKPYEEHEFIFCDLSDSDVVFSKFLLILKLGVQKIFNEV